MFNEPVAAFASAPFFLRSALDPTAAGEGAGGGTDCTCEANVGAAAVELIRLGGCISPITVPMSSAYSPSSSVPSQRNAHAWLSKPNNSSVIVPSFVLAFNSWNCSVVNAPLCLSLPNSAFMPSKAAALIETVLAALVSCLWLSGARLRELSRASAKLKQEFQYRDCTVVGDVRSRRHQINPHLFEVARQTAVYDVVLYHRKLRQCNPVAQAGQPMRRCRVAPQGKGCSFLSCGRCRAWALS